MRVVYSERLWPAWWMWLVAALLAATAGVVVVPVGDALLVAATVLFSAAAVTALLVWWSAPVRVVEPEPGAGLWLQAGTSRVPLEALGLSTGLDGQAWRAALGPGLDARAHLVIRGWVGSGVRVDVDDARDPVPYWLVSSRRPERLAAALAG